MPAREPVTVDITEMLLAEAKADAPALADMAFGEDAFTDSKNLPRGQYLEVLRFANERGVYKKDGTYVPPSEWSALTRGRLGDERFWADLHEAYHMDPAEGLAMVRMAMEPQPADLEPIAITPPPEEMI